MERTRSALAYLDASPGAQRACFVAFPKDGDAVILTVALREPPGVLEIRVTRESFDAMKLFELSLRHPDTSVFVRAH